MDGMSMCVCVCVCVLHTHAERARVCQPPTQKQTASTEGNRKREGIWGRGKVWG